MTLPARRIRVVGISGSGKTTLAREAARRLGLAHLELDEVFWDAGWTFRDLGEAFALLDGFLADHPSGWVMDGNWRSRLGGRLEPPAEADLVVWLDHPRWLVMWRILRRTLRRGLTQEDLWHGNREEPRNWLSTDPAENIVVWTWTHYRPTRERYLTMDGRPDFIRLRGRWQAQAWLDSLSPAAPLP